MDPRTRHEETNNDIFDYRKLEIVRNTERERERKKERKNCELKMVKEERTICFEVKVFKTEVVMKMLKKQCNN